MNYKLEYITRLFQKTNKKRIENYVITRIWHFLDDDEIKIVPQQYVSRQKNKYALTDIYFPQVGIHVEVNEPAHYESQDQINSDIQRKKDIEKQTGHSLDTIDCRKNLSDIHKQINDIVKKINNLIAEQKKNGKFKPWQPDIERNPEHWKKNKDISIEDEISFNNIEDICKLFDADFKKTKRGYLRLGAIPHPENNEVLIWWPSEKTRQGWVNTLSEDGSIITETHEDKDKRSKHFNDLKNTTQKRIVFFHQKDVLGLTSYTFKGVYVYDKEKSKNEVGTVWKKCKNELSLKLNE